MGCEENGKTPSPALEDNLKKALTEILLLHLLSA